MADIKQQRCCVQMLIQPLFWSGGREKPVIGTDCRASTSHSSSSCCMATTECHSCENPWKTHIHLELGAHWAMPPDRHCRPALLRPDYTCLPVCLARTCIMSPLTWVGCSWGGSMVQTGLQRLFYMCMFYYSPFSCLSPLLICGRNTPWKGKKNIDRPTDDHKKGYAKCWDFL